MSSEKAAEILRIWAARRDWTDKRIVALEQALLVLIDAVESHDNIYDEGLSSGHAAMEAARAVLSRRMTDPEPVEQAAADVNPTSLGERYPCKPEIFSATYEPAQAVDAVGQTPDSPIFPRATETYSDLSLSAGVAARPALARPLWDRVAHRYGIDQRDVDWLRLRAGFEQMSIPSVALARPAWQPIETAPKDGRCLLLYGCEYRRRIWGRGYWFQGVPGDGEGWIASAFYTEPSDDMRGTFNPTHWQALPPPPEEPERQT